MTPPSTADTEPSADRALRVLGALAFGVLLVLAGVDPWWMIPLAAVAALLGLTTGGMRLGVVAMAVAAGAGAVAVLASWTDLRDALVTVARDVVTGVLPWSVAVAWRARRAAEADAAAALLRAQDDRRLRAETDLARQRLHLAESLHDDLGHALSLVAVNLGRLELELERDTSVGLRVDTGEPGATGPATEHATESVRESVAVARRQVSDAVARLGASVQTLRTGTVTDTSLPSVRADLDALVREARRAGADVELTGPAGPAHLARFGDAVPRVVRKGLTNALKHAPGQPVRVALDPQTDLLAVSVRNPCRNGRTSQPPAIPRESAAARASGPWPSTSAPPAGRSRPGRRTAPTSSGPSYARCRPAPRLMRAARRPDRRSAPPRPWTETSHPGTREP
nr:hypothetical protein GCM10025730_42070 [Promicromonospora thailandica]